ncbi:MAG: elongation factor 1-beta [Candidatus Thorarchaeota archaeon]
MKYGAANHADVSQTDTPVQTVDLRDHKYSGEVSLARVIIVIKVMPEDVDVDLDNLIERIKENIPEGTDVNAHEIVPIAFGLQALKIRFSREEAMGGTDDIEEAIGNLEGVAQVEVEIVSRM